jgi:polar amino acid transport system substrate-binding protein
MAADVPAFELSTKEKPMRRSSMTLGAVLAAAALLTSACGSDADAGSSSASGGSYGECEVTGTAGEFELETIKPNTLTVKADLPSPGWYNGDTVAEIASGVDYCLLATIAYRSGLDDIELVNTSFDGLVAGKAGDFDISLNQITITPEREEVMDFSVPYFDSTAGMLIKAGADVTEDNLSDLRIGVKQGTVGQSLVTDTIQPTTEISVFPGDPELQAAVAAGRIDVAVQDLSIVLGAAEKSGGKLEVVGQVETDEQYGALFPADSPNVETVNEIITQAQEDGTLTELRKVYLTDAYGMDPTAVPVWQLS